MASTAVPPRQSGAASSERASRKIERAIAPRARIYYPAAAATTGDAHFAGSPEAIPGTDEHPQQL